jgi:hypothetical protein
MTPAQRAAAMSLLSVTLSKRGYEKVLQIMEGDEVNKLEEAKNCNRGPAGGGGKSPLNESSHVSQASASAEALARTHPKGHKQTNLDFRVCGPAEKRVNLFEERSKELKAPI